MSKLGIVTGMEFEADILRASAKALSAEGRLVIVCRGMGRKAAAAAAEAAAGKGAAALMSFGVAGGLDPALTAGSVVLATEIRDGTSTLFADAVWTARLLKAFAGHVEAIHAPLLHARGVVATPAAKAEAFGATGAAATDMESYGLAEAAIKLSLPFVSLRVIADGAEDRIPTVAIAAASADGRINVMKSVLGALTHPMQIPDLIRLGSRTNVARKTMLRLADLGLARDFFL